MADKIELTILMPCLNERESLAYCIKEAQGYIKRSGIVAEILVADNGSVDGSRRIALRHGARVVDVARRGYGSAVIGGIRAARGRYVILGDCDGSYDFSDLDPLLQRLRTGYALVMGNRFTGKMETGAMPFWHRYFGVPLLSWLGRRCYHVPIGDFHCGLRGFDRQKALALALRCGGMEFATELVGRFARAGEPVCEVPVPLRRDKRRLGRSHLRTLADGWRHMRLLLFEWRKRQ